jgi:hypothetical protein
MHMLRFWPQTLKKAQPPELAPDLAPHLNKDYIIAEVKRFAYSIAYLDFESLPGASSNDEFL